MRAAILYYDLIATFSRAVESGLQVVELFYRCVRGVSMCENSFRVWECRISVCECGVFVR